MGRMKSSVWLALGGGLFAGVLASAQEPVAGPAAQPPAVAQEGAAAPAKPAAPAAPSARAQQLSTLKYDRRPSAILGARARPDGAPEPSADSGAVSMDMSAGSELDSGFSGVDTAGQTVVYSTSSSGAVTVRSFSVSGGVSSSSISTSPIIV